MEQEDVRGARVAKVAHDPNRFLSAVQIGITLTGFLSASFGASSIAPFIVPLLEGWGMPNNVASVLTTVLLTIIISYVSIVISELVPKRIALQQTERIARAVVPTIDTFATICTPFICYLQVHQRHRAPPGLRPQRTSLRSATTNCRPRLTQHAHRPGRAASFSTSFRRLETLWRSHAPARRCHLLEGSQSDPRGRRDIRDKPYSRYPVIGTTSTTFSLRPRTRPS